MNPSEDRLRVAERQVGFQEIQPQVSGGENIQENLAADLRG
jgi:hypothetical protein